QWLGRVAKLVGQAGIAYVDGDAAKWDQAVNDPAWESYDPESLARTQQAGERAANAGEAAWAFPAQGVGQHLARGALNAWATALNPFRPSLDKARKMEADAESRGEPVPQEATEARARASQHPLRVWEDAAAIAAAAAARLGLSGPSEPGAVLPALEQDSRWKSPEQLQHRAQGRGGRRGGTRGR